MRSGHSLISSIFGAAIVAGGLAYSVEAVAGGCCHDPFEGKNPDDWRRQRASEITDVYTDSALLAYEDKDATCSEEAGVVGRGEGCFATPLAAERAQFYDVFCSNNPRNAAQRENLMRARIASFAAKLIPTLRKQHVGDLNVMLGAAIDNDIRGLSESDMAAAVTEVGTHTQRATEKMIPKAARKKYERTQPEGHVPTQEEVNARIANNFDKEYGENFQKRFKDSTGFKKFFEGTKNDYDRFALLEQRASQADLEYKDGMSPFYARMILQFAIAKKIPPAQKDGLASKMRLRVNVGESLPATWENMIPHDGYVLGASPAWAKALVNGKNPASSTGIDCSLLIQYVAEGQGYDVPAGELTKRTSTERLRREGIKGFSKVKSCAEKDLKVGDVIVVPGHTFIFSGYEERLRSDPTEYPARYEITPMMIEAVGGENRTVREAELTDKHYMGRNGCLKDATILRADFTDAPAR